jgi:Flp pilus assembly protein TadG
MRFTRSTDGKRRGGVVVLAAFLMAILVGMLAFAIDIGYMSTVKAELQNAADAAALAGAQQLQGQFVLYYSPGQTAAGQQTIYNYVTTNATDPNSPISTAQRFAGYNQAGGVYLQLPTSDISFSYYDGTTFQSSSTTLFPNTITVTTRRDNTANSPLGLFFGNIFGVSSSNITATASATIYAGDVTSLQVIPGVNAHILPVALDVNVWTNFANGNLTSPWVAGSYTTGPNGYPQLQVYPFTTNTPGSFGLVDTGVPSNNAPAFSNWIDNGSTPNDISYLLTNKLLPVSTTAPEPWKVGPGMTSTLLSNFQQEMGVANLIPLFSPSVATPGPGYVAATSTGQNATYAIVGFVGVTITQATGTGTNMNISIQPASIVDPTAVILNPGPARATQLTVFGTPQTTFVSAKLTQ